MTKLTLTAAALALAACSSGPDMRPADVADLGSTAAFLATGNGIEANQLIAQHLPAGGVTSRNITGYPGRASPY